jgi:hypothetical protein
MPAKSALHFGAIATPPPAGPTMLILKPNCECCNIDLPPESRDALICSFECTFCFTCAEGILKRRCPNCSGELERPPIRPAAKLQKFPPSRERIFKPQGCAAEPAAP